MNTIPAPSPAGVAIIELSDFTFNWVAGPEAHDKTREAVIYGINVLPTEQKEGRISGFCEIKLSRTGHKFDNFKIFARYYYASKNNLKQPRSRKTWECNLAKGVVWTKFAELARVVAVNAGSNPYDIPLLPDKVQYGE